MKKKPTRAQFQAPPPVSADDAALFRAAVAGAAQMPASARATHPKPRPQPKPLQHADDAGIYESGISQNAGLSDHLPHALTGEAGIAASHARNGISRETLRKLKRGHWRVQDELDLHGLTVEEARPLLAAFLNASRAADARCVRVIHGKGLRSKDREPVLKTRVAAWLAQHDGVLAYCEARAADGGSGATVVLLKAR